MIRFTKAILDAFKLNSNANSVEATLIRPLALLLFVVSLSQLFHD
jgi:hypothetical protein